MTSAPASTQVPEAVPPLMPGPSLAPHLAAPAVRACYGALLLCAPGRVLRLCTGHAPSPRGAAVTRILGARHLVQGIVTIWRPRPAVFAAGAVIDGCHAASMLALAAADPPLRRAGLTDALAAVSFMAAGAATAVTGRP